MAVSPYLTTGVITSDLLARTRVATDSAAVAIMNEGNAVPGHTERVQLANNVFADNTDRTLTNILCAALAASVDPLGFRPVTDGGTAANDVTADANLQNGVNAVWSAVAGFAPP